MFEMKYFFTAAIAGAAGRRSRIRPEAVRHRIKQLIDAERAERRPLRRRHRPDAAASEGIDIARRTVAKYRESLRIPSSVERRRAKQAMRQAS